MSSGIRRYEWLTHRGCTDKRRFTTRRIAKNAARRFGQSVYKCDLCYGFHLKTRKRQTNP